MMAEKKEAENGENGETEARKEREWPIGLPDRNAPVLRSLGETQLDTMEHKLDETVLKLNEFRGTLVKTKTQSPLPIPSTVSTVSTVSPNPSNATGSTEGRRGRRSRNLAAEGGRSPAGILSSSVSAGGKLGTPSGGGKRGSTSTASWTGLEDETLQVLAQTFQFNWEAIAKSRKRRREMRGRNGV